MHSMSFNLAILSITDEYRRVTEQTVLITKKTLELTMNYHQHNVCLGLGSDVFCFWLRYRYIIRKQTRYVAKYF